MGKKKKKEKNKKERESVSQSVNQKDRIIQTGFFLFSVSIEFSKQETE